MGIIDRCKYNLSCEKCGAKEEQEILDKGAFKGSSWTSPPNFERFHVEWSGEGGDQEPKLNSVTCKECKIAAKVESKQSQ